MLTNSWILISPNEIIKHQIELNIKWLLIYSQPDFLYYSEIVKHRKDNMILKHIMIISLITSCLFSLQPIQ